MKKGLLCGLIVIGILGFTGCSDKKDQNTRKSNQGQALQPATNMKKIISIELTESGLSEILKTKMSAKLAENGLTENKDYVFESKSALGDNATLISLIDAAKKEKPDLLITFQPPTLFASIKRAPELNKVFGILTDPFILGGGKSDEDHLPNLTGLYMAFAADQMAAFLNKLNPKPRMLGAVYLVGEENSVKRLDQMTKALSRYGIKLVSQSYTTQAEIDSAAKALFNKKMDGIIKFPDPNDTMVAAALIPLARKAKIPIYSFGLLRDNLETGFSIKPDFDQVATRFWGLAARALKGEELAKIPFESTKNIKATYFINKKEFDSYKIKIPAEELKDAVLLQ